VSKIITIITIVLLVLIAWGCIELHGWWTTPWRIRERERLYLEIREKIRRTFRR
jgi:hypothetical protein